MPADLNLVAVAHYLEALDMQAKASHLSALFGGKMPMTMTSPPGGTTLVPTVDILANYFSRVEELQKWVDSVFIPDVLAIAPYYLDYAKIGKGHGNYLAWGVFEDSSYDPKKRLLPRGIIMNSQLKAIDAKPEEVTEHVKHSWYTDSAPLNPMNGVTEPNFTEYDTNKNTHGQRRRGIRASPWRLGHYQGCLLHILRAGRRRLN